jgi:hypothetical protein
VTPGRTLGFAGLLAALLVALTVSLALSSAGQRWSGDLQLYHDYSAVFLDGHLTETDFLDWYPAIALLPMVIPHLIDFGGPTSLPIYAVVFAVLMAMTAAGTSVIAGKLAELGDDALGLRAFVISGTFVLLLTSVVVFRYDVVPALFAGAGILAVLIGSPLLAGFAIGVSAGLKIYAVVIAAVIVVWIWAGRDWQALGRFVVGGAIAGAVALGPYLVLTPSNPLGPVAFNTGRPLQVESVGGAVVSLINLGQPLAVSFNYGSFNLDGSLPTLLARLLSPIQLAAVSLTLLCAAYRFILDARRGVRHPGVLVAASMAAVLALILTSKVLSPQYLVWLLPFLPVVAVRSRPLLAVSIAALGLTLVIFPVAYDALLAQHPLMVVVLNARNLLLVILFGSVLWGLIRGAGRTVSQSWGGGDRFHDAARELSPKKTVGA